MLLSANKIRLAFAEFGSGAGIVDTNRSRLFAMTLSASDGDEDSFLIDRSYAVLTNACCFDRTIASASEASARRVCRWKVRLAPASSATLLPAMLSSADPARTVPRSLYFPLVPAQTDLCPDVEETAERRDRNLGAET